MKMKKQNNTKIIWLVLLLPLILTGCISIKKSSEVGSAGGFFLSDTKGDTWAHWSTVYTAGAEVKTFGGANITTMAFDPQDEAAIYLGTQNSGIFYSYNYGQGWTNTLVYNGTINDIVVHPEDKCTIYVAAHNRIWKTEDCSRTWKDVYFEARPGQFVTALNINYDNPNIIYAGTNGGSFLRSLDKGQSWDVLKRFDNYLQQIVVQNHSDSNIIYAVTKTVGVWRSVDGGQNWDNLMLLPVYQLEATKEGDRTFTAIKEDDEGQPFFKISGAAIAVAADSDRSIGDGLLYGNRIGMFRFVGDHWEQLKLLTPQTKETVYSVAVNPLDGNEIFYGTVNALYHTIDNGISWEIKELPTDRVPGQLKISPNNKYLYLGVYRIEK